MVGGNDIHARAFDAAGAALGNEFAVAADIDEETQSTVAGVSNGNYAIAWTDRTPVPGDTSGSHIEASVFSGNGTAVATNFPVNSSTSDGDQVEPSIVSLSNGNFLVAWTDPYAGLGSDILGR